MKIWIVEVGEPLPLNNFNNRPYRYSQLFERLSSRGHEVTWWASDFSHQHKKKIEYVENPIALGEKATIHLIKMPKYNHNLSVMRVFSQAVTGIRFYRVIKKHRAPDLILCAYPVMEMAFFSAFYAKKNKIPVVIDVQDLWPDIFIGAGGPIKQLLVNLFIFPLKVLAGKTFKNASSIVGVSRDYMNFGLKYSNREVTKNDKVFPLAYARNAEYTSIPVIQECLDRKITLVWFVGSFGSTYDIATIIKSASIFQSSSLDDVVFVITGDGDSFKSIENESRDLKNVILTGWLSSDEINFIGQNASTGLMAYCKGAPQGLPNKVFEYMSFGLPMVCSLEGESMDLIVGNQIGLSFTAGDAISLSDAIKKLLNKDLWLEMSKRSKLIFESEYDSDVVYSQYINFLESFTSK